jgi:hypothetical protein
MKIKFNKYNVTNGTVKVRVFYSIDRRCDGRKCVSVNAKDYGRELNALFPGIVKNDSDSMTDYFEKDTVNLFEDHPLYAEARARVESNFKSIVKSKRVKLTLSELKWFANCDTPDLMALKSDISKHPVKTMAFYDMATKPRHKRIREGQAVIEATIRTGLFD